MHTVPYTDHRNNRSESKSQQLAFRDGKRKRGTRTTVNRRSVRCRKAARGISILRTSGRRQSNGRSSPITPTRWSIASRCRITPCPHGHRNIPSFYGEPCWLPRPRRAPLLCPLFVMNDNSLGSRIQWGSGFPETRVESMLHASGVWNYS